jgi:hypothetical protein
VVRLPGRWPCRPVAACRLQANPSLAHAARSAAWTVDVRGHRIPSIRVRRVHGPLKRGGGAVPGTSAGIPIADGTTRGEGAVGLSTASRTWGSAGQPTVSPGRSVPASTTTPGLAPASDWGVACPGGLGRKRASRRHSGPLQEESRRRTWCRLSWPEPPSGQSTANIVRGGVCSSWCASLCFLAHGCVGSRDGLRPRRPFFRLGRSIAVDILVPRPGQISLGTCRLLPAHPETDK